MFVESGPQGCEIFVWVQESYARFRALPVDKQKIMLHDILTGLSDMHDGG